MELGHEAKASPPVVTQLSRMAWGEAFPTHGSSVAQSLRAASVVWTPCFLYLTVPSLQHWITNQPLPERKGKVKDIGMFTLCKTFQGEKMKEVTNVQHRALKSNSISNELVWEKVKQFFTKIPNKFSFF